MGTIQLDAIMPQRFGLSYMGADNQEHTPYVIHRALLGSLERFIGILIEHYGGAFPFWLAPVQVRVLPGRRGACRGGPRHRREARRARLPGRRGGGDRDDRQADPDAPSSRRSPSRWSTATGRARRAWPSGSAEAASPRRALRISRPGLLRLTPEKQGRTRSSPPGPIDDGALVRGSTESAGYFAVGRGSGPLHAAAFLVQSNTRRSKPNLVICL